MFLGLCGLVGLLFLPYLEIQPNINIFESYSNHRLQSSFI